MAVYKHSIEIFYNEEDNGYIAVVPEPPGCSAFVETGKEALNGVKIAMELWLKCAEEKRIKIPKPCGKELLSILYQNIQHNRQQLNNGLDKYDKRSKSYI